MLFKLAGNTKLKDTVSVLNDRIIIQNDLDKLEQWPQKKKKKEEIEVQHTTPSSCIALIENKWLWVVVLWEIV